MLFQLGAVDNYFSSRIAPFGHDGVRGFRQKPWWIMLAWRNITLRNWRKHIISNYSWSKRNVRKTKISIPCAAVLYFFIWPYLFGTHEVVSAVRFHGARNYEFRAKTTSFPRSFEMHRRDFLGCDHRGISMTKSNYRRPLTLCSCLTRDVVGMVSFTMLPTILRIGIGARTALVFTIIWAAIFPVTPSSVDNFNIIQE